MRLCSKPRKISSVEMAAYIDAHIYEKDCDYTRCYEYMYLLYRTVAASYRFFKRAADYEDYAIHAANNLFMRYWKSCGGEGKLPVIKNCLSYVNLTAYPFKVNFEQANFQETYGGGKNAEETTEAIRYILEESVICAQPEFLSAEVNWYFNSVETTIREFLKASPYRCDSFVLNNLYISVVLSLLKSLTLSKDSKALIEKKEGKSLEALERTVENCYQEESKDPVVIFHLDPSMENYVRTLVNKIKRLIVEDLIYLINSNKISNSLVRDMTRLPGITCSNVQKNLEE